MKFNSSLTSSLFLYLGLTSPSNTAMASFSEESDINLPSSSTDISLVDFQGLLYSEINNELEASQLQAQEQQGTDDALKQENGDVRLRGRFLREEDVSPKALNAWNRVVEHGWQTMSSNNFQNSLRRTRHQRQLKEGSVSDELLSYSNSFPFLVCSHSSQDKSAFQRLKPMLEYTHAHSGDATVVRNDPKKTCYHVSLEPELAQKLRESSTSTDESDNYYTVVPLTDLMKIQVDTITQISEKEWMVPSKHSAGDWERLIRVGLSAGHRTQLDSKQMLQSFANDIIEDIKALGQVGAQNRRTRRLQEGKKKTSTPSSSNYDAPVSLSDMFSQTALNDNEGETRNLRSRRTQEKHSSGRLNEWNQALELGLESDHACEAMFDRLDLNVHPDHNGFDIVLNPSTKSDNHNDGIEYEVSNQNVETESAHNDGIEYENKNSGINNTSTSTASNKHCVASLIMGLSTHPLVLSVETEGPIITNDFEAQWITQSKTVGKRPLRDLGIDGKNQIVSVIDSGLDINHKCFGPTSTKVFDEWDHSQQKVVRYDHSVGDMTEPKGGHGTKVAGAAVGFCHDSNDHEANGIAAGAKLHLFDIQQASGGYKMPNAYTFFESMHSTDGTHARVANGSWMTKYRAYPFSCKFFDEALFEDYQGDLFVASAGNEGLDDSIMQSKYNTIGNPASCKNTLAVGASQSYGNRVGSNHEGIDYVAAFSSRGPTYDGRMKPDLVAPGASVLTAFAHEDGKTVQAYGTSFSGPVVAGNAALVRQYFEEGKLPCTWGNCKIDPSGSLVKAVLLNSAQNLKQVQVSRPWLPSHLLEEVSEYDSNQGMGLVQLDQTLPIPGHNKFHAIVRNNKQIADQGFHDIYIKATPGKCANTSYKHAFSATLTWYDPAGATSCAKCLVNDLDIMVHWITAKGKIKQGSKQFPNGATHKEYDNNVERIRFNMYSSRRYRIRIHAANLATATTKFSLVASGCFKVISKPSA